MKLRWIEREVVKAQPHYGMKTYIEKVKVLQYYDNGNAFSTFDIGGEWVDVPTVKEEE